MFIHTVIFFHKHIKTLARWTINACNICECKHLGPCTFKHPDICPDNLNICPDIHFTVYYTCPSRYWANIVSWYLDIIKSEGRASGLFWVHKYYITFITPNLFGHTRHPHILTSGYPEAGPWCLIFVRLWCQICSDIQLWKHRPVAQCWSIKSKLWRPICWDIEKFRHREVQACGRWWYHRHEFIFKIFIMTSQIITQSASIYRQYFQWNVEGKKNC